MADQHGEDGVLQPSTSLASSLLEHAEQGLESDGDKQKAFRKAGEDYFNHVVQQASEGHDPFEQLPIQAKKARPKRAKSMREDPDLLAFGEAFEKTKKYIFMFLFVLCQAASPVLVKGSLYTMQTPGVLTFLHMLAAVLAIWFASMYEVYQLRSLTTNGLKGSAVRALIHGTQMLCTFSALHHNSVNLVIVWTSIGTPLVDAVLSHFVLNKQLSTQVQQVLAVGAAAAVFEFVFDTDKVWVGFLMMSLWTLSKACEWLWQQLKQDATAGGRIADYKWVAKIREISDDEDMLDPASLAFLQNALPAVPVLLIGFLCLEGKELVDHELSVPAVRVMLLACACYTGALCCELLLDDKLPAHVKQYLRTAALFGTAIMFLMEEFHTISKVAVMFTFAVISAASFIEWTQHDVQ